MDSHLFTNTGMYLLAKRFKKRMRKAIVSVEYISFLISQIHNASTTPHTSFHIRPSVRETSRL